VKSPNNVLLLIDGHVDLANRRVVRGEKTANLTPIEQALLQRLCVSTEAELVHGDTLLQEVWGYAPGVRSRAVYTAIQRLRAKLEVDVKSPQHLVSVYGGGYRFVPAPPPQAPPILALPLETCPYFGRADLLTVLRVDLGQPGLVTLHGPGGMGKSRTALRCAHHMVEGCAVPPGGIFIVDVETVTEADGMLDAIFTALEIPWPTELDHAAARDHLIERTSDRKRWLLILDGVERLAEAAGQLCRQLLAHLPRLTVLVTSRLPLGLSDERLHSLAPLNREAGVTLFIDRAGRVRWGLTPTPDERTLLGTLVTEPLGGIPLAIELAAARVAVLSIEDLCTGLSAHTLHDPRRHSPRHQSLDAALSWSFDMLDAEEARALAWLSCFRGSPDLADVRAVLGPAFADSDLIDLLQRLSDAALLRSPATEHGLRYRLLTPIRERAALLLGSDEEDAQAAWFEHIESAARNLASTILDPARPKGRQELPWMRADLLAALELAMETHHPASGTLCLNIDRITEMHDSLTVRRQRIDGALAREPSPSLQLQLRARRVDLFHAMHAWEAALNDLHQMELLSVSDTDQQACRLSRGRHHMRTGDLRQAMCLLREAGDTPRAHMTLGYCHQAQGDHTVARQLYEQAVARFEEDGNGFGAASAMGNLSLTVGELGDLDQAHTIASQMLDIARQLGHGPLQTSASQLLGTYALRACRFSEAQSRLEDAGRLAHHFGNADRAFLIDLNRSELLWELDDLPGAARLLDDCLKRKIGASSMLFAQVLRGALAHAQGELKVGLRLVQRANTLAAELGLADRQVFAGLSLGPLLAEAGRTEEAKAVLDEVESLVREPNDPEGIALVELGRLHLMLASYQAQTDAQLRREIVRAWRRLPEPDGLLLRRAHRLLERVGERSGIRLSG